MTDQLYLLLLLICWLRLLLHLLVMVLWLLHELMIGQLVWLLELQWQLDAIPRLTKC